MQARVFFEGRLLGVLRLTPDGIGCEPNGSGGSHCSRILTKVLDIHAFDENRRPLTSRSDPERWMQALPQILQAGDVPLAVEVAAGPPRRVQTPTLDATSTADRIARIEQRMEDLASRTPAVINLALQLPPAPEPLVLVKFPPPRDAVVRRDRDGRIIGIAEKPAT